MNYVDEVIERLKEEYKAEPEFVEAVTVTLNSLRLVISRDEEKYRKHCILERLVTPDRIIEFRVPWYDDQGKLNINRGYRVQWNNSVGPYKGGLRFHPSVNLSIMKFLAFNQTFKNSLTTLPMGGAKGGSDFDPKGKSEHEVMAFCQSFMDELYKYIGENKDIPAGDIGCGAREIGYMFGEYRRLTDNFAGVLTGKGLSYGGSLARKEATGYGLLYITRAMLDANNISIKDKRVIVSGAGNVAIYAIEKALELGAKVITASDSSGYIYDPNGIDLKALKEVKEVRRGRIKEYLEFHPEAVFHAEEKVWNEAGDIYLPCATQNEFDINDAKRLVSNGGIALCEGANMPLTNEAVDYLVKNKVLYIPGKASNAGGVSTSLLEMHQNSIRLSKSFSEVDELLKEIMNNIFAGILNISKEYNLGTDYKSASDILAFIRLSEAMISQGI